ncbi:MAG: DUF748 domain-containing protein [Bacteroidales bacterium]
MKPLHIKKRYKVILGIGLFIFVLLFAAPRFGCWYIVKHSHELIGRKLEIKKIRINYITGTFRLHEVKLYEADSKTVFMSFKQLIVKFKYLPLFRNEIFVKNISLDDPFIEVLQNGNKYNFSDLEKKDTITVAKDTLPSKPMKYNINNIKINRGYVKYTDEVINHTIALNKLDLLIPGFTWNSDSTNLDVNFRFVDGGGLYSSLELNQADSTYSVSLKLDSLNLGIIEPYVQNYLHISALHGYLSNDIKITGNMKSVMKLLVRGINHVFDFSITDTLSRKILSFKDLTIDINTLQPDKNKVSLNSINLTDPVFLFEMFDSTNNWLALVKTSTKPDTLQQKADSTTGTDIGSYSFSKLKISGGKILFSDKTLRYPFEYAIDNINLESKPVPGTPDKLAFNISAGLNGTGTFLMKAILNPSDLKNMDLGLTIGQFRMKDVDAYFKHYFGYPVIGGIMNFKTENRIRQESLVSENSMYFRKFTLAKPINDKIKYHIPLRLALGILSDKDGIIDLKAPVESKGKEVKVRNLGKIIFHVIGNLFVKAAVSPFNLLSSTYKVDPATLQEIHLGLMEPSPDEKNLKSVDIIADILNKKPGLNIDFYYCSDHSKLVDSLAYNMTISNYFRDNKISNAVSENVPDSTLIRYLMNKSSSGPLGEHTDIKVLCRRFIGVETLEAKLDSVKMLQINFIRNYLSRDKEIAPDRFKINPVAPDTIKPLGNYPSFRTYFAAGEKKE